LTLITQILISIFEKDNLIMLLCKEKKVELWDIF